MQQSSPTLILPAGSANINGKTWTFVLSPITKAYSATHPSQVTAWGIKVGDPDECPSLSTLKRDFSFKAFGTTVIYHVHCLVWNPRFFASHTPTADGKIGWAGHLQRAMIGTTV